MRTCYFCFILLLSSKVNSQYILPTLDDTLVPKHEISLSGVADYASSSILNSMSNKLLYGGEITDAIKTASFDKHGVINRFGVNLQGEIEYRNTAASLFKNHDLGYGIKAGYYSFGGVVYPKDLFGLAFYGNAIYSGKTADFSGTSFSFYSFQKIGFSLIDKKSSSSITLNLVNLSSHSSLRVNEGTIYQSLATDTLSLTVNANLSNTGGNSLSKGVGFCLDADFRLPMKGLNDNVSFLQILVTTGLTFDELINSNGPLTPSFSALDSLSLIDKESRNSVLLPGMIQVSKLVEINSSRRFQEYYGFRIFLSKAFIPMVFVGLDTRLGRSLHIGVNGSYGGFSDFMLGMYSYYKIGAWSLGVGSENIIGVFTNKAYGEAISIRLRCGF